MFFKSFLLFTSLIWCIHCQNDIPVQLLEAKNIVIHDYHGNMDAKTLELLENVETLTLDGCNFTSFNKNFLHPLKNLQKFVFSNSQFNKVQSDISTCCSKLRTVEVINTKFGPINQDDLKRLAQRKAMERFHLHKMNIPNIPANCLVGSNLKSFEVEYSNLAIIEDGAFNGMEKLEILNLRNNKLTTIPTGSLASLKTLKELHLGSNLIQKVETKDIPSLPNLEKLNLGFNPIQGLNLRGLKKKLPKLKEVDVSGMRVDLLANLGVPLVMTPIIILCFLGVFTTNKMIFKTFLLFTSLIWCIQCQNDIPVQLLEAKDIVIHDYHGNMDATTLELLENVETLTLDGCNFTSFNENFLHPLKNLQKLVLSNSHFNKVQSDIANCCSKLRTVEVINTKFEPINQDDLKKLAQMKAMERFHLHKINIPNIPANCLVGSNLKSFEVEYSNLASIEDGAFNGMEKLEILILRNNKLKTIPTISLASLKSLKELHLGNNKIEKVETKDIPSLPNLEKLNLGFNPIEGLNLRGLKKKLPKLKEVDVSGMRVDLLANLGVPLVMTPIIIRHSNFGFGQLEITNKMIFKTFLLFTTLIWCVHSQNGIPVQLLEAKDIVIQDYHGTMNAKTLELLENVETLTLDGCNFSSFNENFLHPLKNLQTIVLSNSHFNKVQSDISTCCSKLRTVEVINTKFGPISQDDLKKLAQMKAMERFYLHKINIPVIQANCLVGSNLKNFEVEYSNLANIEDGAFNGMEKLEILILRNNKLKTIPTGSLASLKTLKELHLGSNLIEKVETKDIPSLPNLERVNLGHNPIKEINLTGLKEKLPKLKEVDVSGINIDVSKNQGVPLIKVALD
ncbi:leucine-rich repeat-containing protein 40-like [Harmonia axyridis]|uniref:leucine-rich repeat-containing protein 40-like n=1 Tax=Harmonia axyridis TaxID=115357 RepID=UPI001E278AB2|nr:leucine-rich repeat-containing protein 40-like [Harmonia axyridis]